MELLLWLGILIVSLIVLGKGADIFTDAAEKIGTRLGISSFVIGITIVSIGTTLPELATSILAVIYADGGGDTTQIVAANVIGSNITNILLAVGLVALLYKGISLRRFLVHVDLPLLAGAVGLVILLCRDGVFDFKDAIITLIGYGVYFAYIYSQRPNKIGWFQRRQKIGLKLPLLIAFGAIAVYFGAEWTVKSVIQVADMAGMTQAVIAMFAVALGTSLPEIAVSIQAASRGNKEMAIGNVLGANMFDLLVVMGIPALMSSLTISKGTLSIGVPFLILSTVIFTISTIFPNISRAEGAMYLLIYAAFIGKLFAII